MSYYKDNIRGIAVEIDSYTRSKELEVTGKVKNYPFSMLGSSLILINDSDDPIYDYISDLDFQEYKSAIEECLDRIDILEEESYILEALEWEDTVEGYGECTYPYNHNHFAVEL